MDCPICGEELLEQYILRGDIVTGYEYECENGDGVWSAEELIAGMGRY
jgi:hypothetical protein